MALSTCVFQGSKGLGSFFKAGDNALKGMKGMMYKGAEYAAKGMKDMKGKMLKAGDDAFKGMKGMMYKAGNYAYKGMKGSMDYISKGFKDFHSKFNKGGHSSKGKGGGGGYPVAGEFSIVSFLFSIPSFPRQLLSPYQWSGHNRIATAFPHYYKTGLRGNSPRRKPRVGWLDGVGVIFERQRSELETG